jgi:hypothetical protein
VGYGLCVGLWVLRGREVAERKRKSTKPGAASECKCVLQRRRKVLEHTK